MVIKIGTDCSGIEAPVQALKQMNIPYQHVWSCEIDKHAEKSILANYNPQKMYHDITKRKHASLPDVDIYVCGFPCQPYSGAGQCMGWADPRSNVLHTLVKLTSLCRPDLVLLENVRNILKFGTVIRYIKEEFEALGYHVAWTEKDIGDFSPQVRSRVIFCICLLYTSPSPRD